MHQWGKNSGTRGVEPFEAAQRRTATAMGTTPVFHGSGCGRVRPCRDGEFVETSGVGQCLTKKTACTSAQAMKAVPFLGIHKDGMHAHAHG